MPDDPSKRRPQDSSRINIHEEYEIIYWTSKWGVTAEQLRDCVKKAGVMVADVKKCLGK
jgi:hypothetical protein